MIRRKPYRILVSAVGFRRGKLYKGRGPHHKGAHSKIEPMTYGYVAWTPDQTAEPSRWPGSGTFLFNGLHVAYREVHRILREPRTRQVQIRTNQDRTLYVWNKYDDGRITGHWAAE